MMSTKKSFSHANPAMSFISSPILENEQIEDQELETRNISQKHILLSKQQKNEFNVPMKRNPEFIEVKSKRMQLLMQPSLHSAIKILADKEELSVNEKIHSILKDYVEKSNI